MPVITNKITSRMIEAQRSGDNTKSLLIVARNARITQGGGRQAGTRPPARFTRVGRYEAGGTHRFKRAISPRLRMPLLLLARAAWLRPLRSRARSQRNETGTRFPKGLKRRRPAPGEQPPPVLLVCATFHRAPATRTRSPPQFYG